MDMIFTHFGFSGPAVLRCSQFAVKELMKGREAVPMQLDVFPDESVEQVIQSILAEISNNPKNQFEMC